MSSFDQPCSYTVATVCLPSIAQGNRSSLVEEYPQVGLANVPRALRRRQASLCVAQDDFDLFSGHSGEPLQEVIHARASFEVLEQSLDGNARASEQPLAADLSR